MKNVLIACEFSATVRDAFNAVGCNAWSCDLLPTQGRAGNHLQGDVRWAIDGWLGRFDAYDIRTGRRPLYIKWDLMIAHPDCTFLSSSGLHWNKNPSSERFGGAQTEEALKFVEYLMGADIDCIGVENPVGCVGTRIRPCDQIIQPYEFGHDASKRTCLWLKNLPLLTPTEYVQPRIVEGKKRWANQTDSGQNKLGPSDDRWKLRAATYPGIAAAMADQWGRL